MLQALRCPAVAAYEVRTLLPGGHAERVPPSWISRESSGAVRPTRFAAVPTLGPFDLPLDIGPHEGSESSSLPDMTWARS
jgi:hypothetical protein